MDDESADYIGIFKVYQQSSKRIVAVMRWNHADDSYVMRESTAPLTIPEAATVARRWAHEKGLEVR